MPPEPRSQMPPRLELALAHWSMDKTHSDELPAAAMDALEAGLDSPSLRRLAGLTQPTYWNAVPLFERALGELGVERMPQDDAMRVFIRDEARKMLSGDVEPWRAGFNWLLSELGYPSEGSEELWEYFNLSEQWDERHQPWSPHTPEEIQEQMLDLARRILAEDSR